MADAKIWFPVSFLLVAVIYTGSKSLVCPATVYPGPWSRVHLADASAIPVNPSLHNLQESNYHPYRLWRGSMVWRISHWTHSRRIRPHGRIFRHCSLV